MGDGPRLVAPSPSPMERGKTRFAALGAAPSPSPSPMEREQGGEATEGREVAETPAWVLRLGLIDYAAAWELQRRAVAARVDGTIPDVLILVEHPHVYTLGRGSHAENVLVDEAALSALGAQLFWVDRGGDVTYHGPGQLVGYPIVHLARLGKDVHQHLRRIEAVLIRALADFGVEGRRDPEHTGVWVGDEKIAAIGVHVSHWVTSHGFALNVEPDLSYFDRIIPCGIRDKGVTSLAKLLGRPVSRSEAETAVLRHFEEVFDVVIVDDTAAGGWLEKQRSDTRLCLQSLTSLP